MRETNDEDRDEGAGGDSRRRFERTNGGGGRAQLFFFPRPPSLSPRTQKTHTHPCHFQHLPSLSRIPTSSACYGQASAKRARGAQVPRER